MPNRPRQLTPPVGPFDLNRDSLQARGLVGWWPAFGGYDGHLIRDRAGGGLDLTAQSGVTFGADGTLGVVGNYTSGGSAKATSSDSHVLLTGAYTWTIWLWEPTFAGTGSATQPVVGGTTSDSWGFSWIHGSSSFVGAAYHQNSGGSYFSAKLTTASLLQTRWYLIAGSWDGTNTLRARAFGDGYFEEVATTGVASVKALSGNFALNSAQAAVKIGDARLYNVDLPTAALYQMWAPLTRWELYQTPKRRSYSVAAAAAGRFRRIGLDGGISGGRFGGGIGG